MIADIFRQSVASSPELRIAVILDGQRASRSAAATLQDIAESNFARCVLAILPGEVSGASRTSPAPTPTPRVIDRRADPLKTVDVLSLLADIPCVYIEPPEQDRLSLTSDQRTTISDAGVDVVLQLGFTGVRPHPDLLSVVPHGVWSWDPAGDPPFIHEMIGNHIAAEVRLRAFTAARPDGIVLSRGIFPLRSRVLPSRARTGPIWGSQYFVIQKLNQLHQHGWDSVAADALKQPAPAESGQPATGRLALTAKLGLNSLRAFTGKALSRTEATQDWRIGLRTGHRPLVASSGSAREISGFSWIPNPPGRFYADPCLYNHKGESWLFLEDMDFRTGYAGISAVRTDSVRDRESFVTALDLPYHLSYPMVFGHEGEVFMIPESSAAGNVQLYRAVRFPSEWKLEKTLYDGLPLVDTTPLLHEGVWYFFTSVEEPAGNVNTALLFTAPSLTGSWTLHSASPVTTDVRNSRSAGPIVSDGARLLRPTQDCLRCYGYGFGFNEITRLNEREFAERPVAAFGPDQLPGFSGTHTYGRLGDLEALDAMRYVPRATIMSESRGPEDE